MASVYRTIAGETWDFIAKKLYGKESDVSFLMGHNQHLLEFFIFPEGIILNVPEKPKEVSLLPEWRL